MSLADRREYGNYPQMTLTWEEWDRLAAWVGYQRAEQRVS